MQKITILYGAGAVNPWQGTTTAGITEAIKDIDSAKVEDQNMGLWLHEMIVKGEGSNNSTINFETYIDFVETICEYLQTGSNLSKFFSINSEILKGIENLKYTNGSTFYSNFEKMQFTFERLISTVKNKIRPYLNNYVSSDFDAVNNAIIRFYNYFLLKGFSIRSYTLNYDRSIPLIFEKYQPNIEIFDGFNIYSDNYLEEKSSLFFFNKSRVINDTTCSSFYNLHGSAHWVAKSLPYKLSNYKLANILSCKNYNHHNSQFDLETNLDKVNPNEKIISSEIITGFKKSQRITVEPFNLFYQNFVIDIFKSEIIIIVGYSFSAPHINQLIESALSDKKRVYIVDYRKSDIENNRLGFIGYQLPHHNVFERGSSDTFWARNVALNCEIYINGFREFLTNSEWLKIQSM